MIKLLLCYIDFRLFKTGTLKLVSSDKHYLRDLAVPMDFAGLD